MATSLIPCVNSMHVILRYDFKDHLRKELQLEVQTAVFREKAA